MEKMQHYKTRNSPWIKLHANLLDDERYCRLPDVAKAHAIGLMLLACKSQNRLPADPEYLGRRIAAQQPVDLEALLASGLFEPALADDASIMLATCLQDASTMLASGDENPENGAQPRDNKEIEEIYNLKSKKKENINTHSFGRGCGGNLFCLHLVGNGQEEKPWPKTPPRWQTVGGDPNHPCAELLAWFEGLWARHPGRDGKKVGKQEAWERIFLLRPKAQLRGRMEAKQAEDVASEQWRRGYAPDMHRWIAHCNKNGWELERVSAPRLAANGGHYAKYDVAK